MDNYGWKQPVVKALALRSGDAGLTTRSDHWLIFFLVVSGSTAQLRQFLLNFLFCRGCVSLALRSLYGE